MRKPNLAMPFVFMAAAAGVVQSQQAPAQPAAGSMAVNVSWKCAAPNPTHSLPVPDKANHGYGIDSVKCTATSGEIGGVKEKEGTGTEFAEVTGNKTKGHGMFVETLANGDAITYSYQFTGTMKDNMPVSGSNTWQALAGTGKFKGIKGKGTCKAKGNPDGTMDYSCTGAVSTAMAK